MMTMLYLGLFRLCNDLSMSYITLRERTLV